MPKDISFRVLHLLASNPKVKFSSRVAAKRLGLTKTQAVGALQSLSRRGLARSIHCEACGNPQSLLYIINNRAVKAGLVATATGGVE